MNIQNINSPTDRERYDRQIRQFIDRDVPAIARINDAFHSFVVICGYEEDQVYCVKGESTTPEACHYDELIFATSKKPGHCWPMYTARA